MDRFGNYTIEHELGRGGMGVVYAARHAILGHPVALKILHAELSVRDDVVQRFFNEARAAAAIHHPGIVRVHDVGIAENAAFLVMDLLPGESLAHRVKTRGPLPVPLAVAIVRQIAVALGAAHAAGIVHRDLKPDNIFLVDAAHGLHAVILDFGVAKLTGALQSGSDLKTKTGALLGTPHYMSPEQCDGERDIDHRSDLYSLGCMLFHVVSGKLPFEGGIGAVIGAHLHVPAPALRSVLAGAPPAIDAIVARLMAKDPAARFASAEDLVAALDAYVPAPGDHLIAPPRMFDLSRAETLPVTGTPPPARVSDPTIESLPPPPSERESARARPSIKPPDASELLGEPAPLGREEVAADTVREERPPFQRPSEPTMPPPSRAGRRRVLAIGAALGLAGIGALVFALTRPAATTTAHTDAQVAQVSIDATIVDAAIAAVTDAAILVDAEQLAAANRIDAQAKRPPADARLATVARDAAIDAPAVAAIDASTIDAPQVALDAIQRRLAQIANAEEDWEASREYMILEAEAPGDPRLARARDDARKAINKLARDKDRKAVHLALVDHEWEKGVAKCREWGDYPRVDIVVQCIALACVAKDDASGERWLGGVPSGPMRRYIGKFCERYRKD